MERECFVFYKSFYEAIKVLPEKEQLECYNAIYEYVFSGREIETNGIAKSIFTLVKPQIDASNTRYDVAVENGKKGGAPKGSKNNPNGRKGKTKNLPITNQELTENKPTTNHNDNDNDNDNDNVNEKDNDNENINTLSVVSDFDKALKDFEDMRKKIKKPLTDRAKQMILNKLSKLSTDENIQIKILEQSTLHCWQDVYELKEDVGNTTNAFDNLRRKYGIK